MLQVSQFKWVPKVDAIDNALNWMQPQSDRGMMVELPEAITNRRCRNDNGMALTYRRQRVCGLVQTRITAPNAGVATGKLLQTGRVCLHRQPAICGTGAGNRC